MKTRQDPRHQRRTHIMQQLFAYSFSTNSDQSEIAAILPALATLDGHITTCAPEWPLDKIAKIDLAILRLAIFELIVEKTQPPKVIIDEAIELGKEFGNEHSPHFINGVLGTIYKSFKDKS